MCIHVVVFLHVEKTSLHFPPFAPSSLRHSFLLGKPLNFEVIQTTTSRLKAHKQFVSQSVCVCVCEIGTKTDSNHHHHDHKKFHSTLYTLSLETPPVCLDTVLMLLIFTQTKKRVMRVGTHFSGNFLCYRRA